MATLRERIEELEAEKARRIEVMKRQIKAALEDYQNETGQSASVELHVEGDYIHTIDSNG